MSSITHEDKIHRDQPSLVLVGWAILVMGLSLAAIAIVYIGFGHLGSAYSSKIMEQQQRRLRQQYGLPPKPIITDPKILEIPPSLRNILPSIYYNNPK
jgi:hypothetical protein